MDRLERVGRRLPRRTSLKHRTWIRALFDRSQPSGSLAAGCIRVVFRLVSEVDSAKRGRVFVGFSPGSRVRGSVKRNRIKRLLRECYRQEQGILLRALPDLREALTLMIVFRGDAPLPISTVREDTRRVIASLASRLGS